MLDYIKRMTIECVDLTGKIKRAKNALCNENLHLDKTQGVLLQKQHDAMLEYYNFLTARIAYEKKLHGVN